MKKKYIYLAVMIFFTLQIRAQNFVNGNFEQGPYQDGQSGLKGDMD